MKYPARDKLLHFIAGACVFLLTVLVFDKTMGLIACVISGAGKEVWDNYAPRHQADIKDFLWTMFGGLLAWAWLFTYEFIQVWIMWF